MKSLILIACLLFVNVSFSQEDSKVILKEKLRPLLAVKPSNNSEGKFPFYNNIVLTDIDNTDNSKSIVEGMSVRDNKIFVNNLVLKILQEKHIDISDFKNSIDSNGDGKLSFYKHYTTDENKLIVTYSTKKNELCI